MASARALKLLERLRLSKSGAKPEDVKALYLAFGFVVESRKRHDCATHPNYPELYGYIPRHRKLATYVAEQAVELAERVLVLEQTEETRNDQE